MGINLSHLVSGIHIHQKRWLSQTKILKFTSQLKATFLSPWPSWPLEKTFTHQSLPCLSFLSPFSHSMEANMAALCFIRRPPGPRPPFPPLPRLERAARFIKRQLSNRLSAVCATPAWMNSLLVRWSGTTSLWQSFTKKLRARLAPASGSIISTEEVSLQRRRHLWRTGREPLRFLWMKLGARCRKAGYGEPSYSPTLNLISSTLASEVTGSRDKRKRFTLFVCFFFIIGGAF